MKKLPILLICILCFALGSFITKIADNESITTNIILQAQKIMGLEFTPAEADSMVGELKDNLANYEKIRQISLNNEVSPALNFNPIPVGFEFEKAQKPIKYSTIKAVSLPQNRDDLAFYSVRELAELIRTRKITSLELTKFFIDRLKKHDSNLWSA
jgi:hypothetical protein